MRESGERELEGVVRSVKVDVFDEVGKICRKRNLIRHDQKLFRCLPKTVTLDLSAVNSFL